MAQDPVHFDAGSWWFYEEDWSHRQGPFATEAIARAALNAYAKEFLAERIVDPEEERI
jgi:hypothetical protein